MKNKRSLQTEFLWALLNSPQVVRTACYKLLSLIIYQKRQKTMSRSIQLSFNGFGQNEAKHIAKQSVNYQASGILNCLDTPGIKHELINSTPYFDLPSHLKGQSAVFVSLHMGFADLPTYLLNKVGIPTATLIGRGENAPALNTIGRRILEQLSIPYIKRGKNTMLQLMEALAQGQSLMIHSDLRERGQKVSFLNRETTIPTTAAALAVLSDSPLYFCYTVKDSANADRCQLYISEVSRPASKALGRKELISALTDTIALKMQEAISLHPEQWFWSYNRFK
ncbi:lysophospholipid acyltransferase family protein [Pseudoteredinibacter isoporae]|uniref:Lauroyl/myristoyl acyltransferase n=1 Tax=Pseudoteredinibacter isoporae TaxID=570281 RepID=A0A7X0MXR1_9GAMM|nr:lysophospholipid acyltransferase family protein [Pseudoteredinibacter isoporae]MBB6522259.1 lauroyl/myristoyl acyltransferase [Pseudoteredinibacter isoporae]NHO87792.1 lysophospholipid acyltransferase family protein [Pseudoteredinibacter isoporae]NIB23877.1 lysophospholipid acyltransferase family protein [Pseudoteredinibacter isoporae]